MAEELKANQRKEWAKLMYLKENITQQEIADRVGVSRVTVNKWANGSRQRRRPISGAS